VKRLILLCLFILLPQATFAQQPTLEEAQPAAGLGLADSLLAQGRFGDAQRLASRALEKEPENLHALRILAKVALGTGELEQAETRIDQLLELDPEVPDHHALQGMLALFQNHTEQSIQSLNKAIQLGRAYQADFQQGYYANTLVLAYHKADRAEEALQHCLHFLEEYPEEIHLYLTASRLYREAGNHEGALQVALDGLERQPEFPNLYASVALAEAALGNEDRSEEAYRKLLQLDPELGRELRATLDGVKPDSAEYQLRVD